MSSIVRVGIVDDHPLMLEGIAQTVRSIDGFEIVGLGSSMNDSLIIARSQRPEIMLLDVSMPGGGIEAARRIAEEHPAIKLMMLTVSERYDHVTEALKIGVMAYLLKGASSLELRDSLRAVVNGKRYITTELLMGMLVTHDRKVQRAEDKPEPAPQDGFTVREKDVVELLARGKPNKKIAEDLGISEKTVKHYMTIIMQKLNVQNRVEAVIALTQKQSALSALLDDSINPIHHHVSNGPQLMKASGHV
jgi:two-component system, NarL family, nitrate/nitrite response regulator NarL